MSNCFIKTGCAQTTQLNVTTAEIPNTVIASLRLNSSRIRNSNLLLSIVTNLNITGLTDGTLTFQVLKQCDGQNVPIPVGTIWNYSPIAVGSFPIAFNVADDDLCCTAANVCCTYTLVVSGTGITGAGTITFANSSFAAIVAGKEDSNCCRM